VSDVHRTRGFIPWTKVDARLQALREIWVATASPDGRPDAVPVWFWWDGTSVYFTTKGDSRKALNIAQQPSVTVHNGDGADPIIVKGDAEVVTGREELERLDRAYAAKYVDPGSGARATVFVEGDVAFRVRPRIVMAWEYATCSNRTDWRFDAAVPEPTRVAGVS
jgi:nitroimidazol reductase NimA-like FMN-containing flavoprotein (pyridoxamine 5'-phosphate oxidase superfamily)